MTEPPTERLLHLQQADTTTDQLRHRLAHLPEAEAATAAAGAVARWQRSVDALRARLDELAAEVERDEQAAKDIDTKRSRLQQQLRTVIAPREAEALQSQIATLTERRSELDDRELEALEAQAEADDALVAAMAEEPALRDALAAAEAARSNAVAVIDDELALLDRTRTALREGLDAGLLERYDHLRAQFGGVAIARLVGNRCEGCHLDMSAAELDTVKRVSVDELAECPNCGRLLVR